MTTTSNLGRGGTVEPIAVVGRGKIAKAEEPTTVSRVGADRRPSDRRHQTDGRLDHVHLARSAAFRVARFLVDTVFA